MTERRYLHDKATDTPYEMVRTGNRWHKEPAGASPGLYGSVPDPGDALWITEGQSDCDAVIAAGGSALTLAALWGGKRNSLPTCGT